MGTTDVEICATALTRLGMEPISSFGDGTAEAIVASHEYPKAKRAYLTARSWEFNRKYARLNRLVEAPLEQWQYQFQLPNDYLHLLEIAAPWRVPYALAGEARLLADIADVAILYQADLDESLFPPLFEDALIWAVAERICLSLNENTERQRAASERFQMADMVASARHAMAQQAPRIRRFPLTAVR